MLPSSAAVEVFRVYFNTSGSEKFFPRLYFIIFNGIQSKLRWATGCCGVTIVFMQL